MSKIDAGSLDALAFLYLTFGHATDGELTKDEMRSLGQRLQARAPEVSLEDLGQVLRRVVDGYKAQGSRAEKIERAQQHAATLRDHIDQQTREAIIIDLHNIAKADGEVSEQEKQFIIRTAQTLGVELPG